MNAIFLVTLTDVAPVQNRHRAVWALAELDATEPRIVRLQNIGLVLHHQGAAHSLDGFDVHAPAMHIKGHQLIAVRGRPVITLINHHPDVRVAATKVIRATAATVSIVPLLARVPVVVVGLLVDEFVDERIGVFAMHPLEVSTVDTLPAMPDHGVDEQ